MWAQPKPDIAARHVQVFSDAAARATFITFPFPAELRDWHSSGGLHLGLYRLEVTPEGNVAAVTILRTMGHPVDVIMLKHLIHWRARLGPSRVIDVGWRFGPKHVHRSNEMYELVIADPEHIPEYIDNAPHYSGWRTTEKERIEQQRDGKR